MIINSLLDTDYYKYTQMHVVFLKYPQTKTEFAFKWRNFADAELLIPIEDFASLVNKEVDHLCTLSLSPSEIKYLKSLNIFDKQFIEYLNGFRLRRDHIKVSVINNELDIYIGGGTWLEQILFEIPVLAIVSELYTNNASKIGRYYKAGTDILDNALGLIEDSVGSKEPFYFSDFGTRRRASLAWHDMVIQAIKNSKVSEHFVGTSNLHFAMRFNLKPIGTMAHEFLQAHQQLAERVSDSQKKALQVWADVYRGELGIALSDIFGFDYFLKDFDRYFAMLYDGCRHDSGDPYVWADKLIAHYKGLRIDPKTKVAVFSDGLTMKEAIALYTAYNSSINTMFGIGTNLTNNCGFKAPQIVIKMISCNGYPVAKLSDSPGKEMCRSPEYVEALKRLIAKRLKED